MPFKANTRFSPQLCAAIDQLHERKAQVSRLGETFQESLRAKEPFRSRPELLQHDWRDFSEMVELPLGITPEETQRKAMEFYEDYWDVAHPERREARLKEFYDRVDALEPFRLDLSLLEGKNPGPRGADGLTHTERDTLRLLQAVRYDQTIGTKAKENQAWYDARYADPDRYDTREAQQDQITSGFNIFCLPLYTYNGFDTGMNRLAPQMIANGRAMLETSKMSRSTEIAARLALTRGRALNAIREGRTPAPVELEMPASLYRRPGAAPLDDDTAAGVFRDTVELFYNGSSQPGRAMKKYGLDVLDMVYIDGQPAARLFDRPGSQNLTAPEKNARVMRLLTEGTHRLELGHIRETGHGPQVEVLPTKLDFHEMDALQKKSEHGWFRRLFDFGLTKITTTADRIDRFQNADTQAEVRAGAIRDAANQKLRDEILPIRERTETVRREMEPQLEGVRQFRARRMAENPGLLAEKNRLNRTRRQAEQALAEAPDGPAKQEARESLQRIREEQARFTLQFEITDLAEKRAQRYESLLKDARTGLLKPEELEEARKLGRFLRQDPPTPDDLRRVQGIGAIAMERNRIEDRYWRINEGVELYKDLLEVANRLRAAETLTSPDRMRSFAGTQLEELNRRAQREHMDIGTLLQGEDKTAFEAARETLRLQSESGEALGSPQALREAADVVWRKAAQSVLSMERFPQIVEGVAQGKTVETIFAEATQALKDAQEAFTTVCKENEESLDRIAAARIRQVTEPEPQVKSFVDSFTTLSGILAEHNKESEPLSTGDIQAYRTCATLLAACCKEVEQKPELMSALNRVMPGGESSFNTIRDASLRLAGVEPGLDGDALFARGLALTNGSCSSRMAEAWSGVESYVRDTGRGRLIPVPKTPERKAPVLREGEKQQTPKTPGKLK